MSPVRTFALFIVMASLSVAAEPKKAIDPGDVRGKVCVKLDQEVSIRFKRAGKRLLEPAIFKPSEGETAEVTILLGTTSASPTPPPREGAKRPFLQVSNNLETALRFRVLARNRGSKEFFEITEGIRAVPPGEAATKCWDFDSLVEEVVLYQFDRSDESPE